MIDLIRDFPFPVAGLDWPRSGIPRGQRYLCGHARDVGGLQDSGTHTHTHTHTRRQRSARLNDAVQ